MDWWDKTCTSLQFTLELGAQSISIWKLSIWHRALLLWQGIWLAGPYSSFHCVLLLGCHHWSMGPGYVTCYHLSSFMLSRSIPSSVLDHPLLVARLKYGWQVLCSPDVARISLVALFSSCCSYRPCLPQCAAHLTLFFAEHCLPGFFLPTSVLPAWGDSFLWVDMVLKLYVTISPSLTKKVNGKLERVL